MRGRTLRAGALVVALAGVFAVPTYADAATLVSNTGQNTDGTYTLEDSGEFESQGFRTGSNTTGYSLTAVKLSIGTGISTSDALLDLKVTLRAKGSGNHPASTDLATFISPSLSTLSTAGVKTFDLFSTYDLKPNTDYFIVVNVTGTGIDFPWDHTASTSEDSGRAPGWSIHDESNYIDTTSGDWSINGSIYQIEVEATAKDLNPAVRSCVHAPGEEVWRATMSVGSTTSSGITATGADQFVPYGSFSRGTFSYRGAEISVSAISIRSDNNKLTFLVGRRSGTVPDDGLGLLGLGTFTLQMGNTCIAIANPGTELRFEFADHGLSWSNGGRIPVRLTKARDWQRGGDERFTTTSVSNTSNLQAGNGFFAQGFRLAGRNFNISAGFVLENVQIEYRDPDGDVFSAKICETDGDYNPGDPLDPECTDLIPPSSFPSVSGNERPLLSFRAPSGGIFLTPRGRYAVVLETGASTVVLGQSVLDGIDSKDKRRLISGFADFYRFHQSDITWEKVNNRVFRMRINGSEPPRHRSLTQLLSALDVSHDGRARRFDGPLVGGAFHFKRFDYTLTVPHGVDTLTVTPTTSSPGDGVAYLDGEGNAITDADTSTDALDAALETGLNVIKVQVVPHEDLAAARTVTVGGHGHGSNTFLQGPRARTYTIQVRRPSGPPTDTCSHIWCANLTWGQASRTGGWTSQSVIHGGGLAPTTFTHNSVDYRVFHLKYIDYGGGTESRSIAFKPALPAGDYTLGVDGQVFQFTQAESLGRLPQTVRIEGDAGTRMSSLELGDVVRVALASGHVSGLNQEVTLPDPLTVEVESKPPRHNGADAFDVDIAFGKTLSEDFSPETLQDHALDISGGGIVSVSRIEETGDLRNKRWRVRIQPSGKDDVVLTLNPGPACGEANAVCTDADEKLPEAFIVTVGGPVLKILNMGGPSEHDGSSPFEVLVQFSEAIWNSWTHVKQAVTAEGGTVNWSRRMDGRSDLWRLKVTPDEDDEDKGPVKLTFNTGGTCGDTPKSAVICTPDGRVLTESHSDSIEIDGPIAITVADAEATEGTDANMVFTVKLSRWPVTELTVNYATANGTAIAGEDYTETTGTLSFRVRETSKTVSVPITNDSHNDDGETFTLTLSEPSRGYLKDGTATGTIRNTDPMPKAWIARFGRTVGTQAVDAVTGRLGGGGQTHVTLGGRSLPLGKGSSGLAGAGAERDSNMDADMPDTDERSILTQEETGGVDQASLLAPERTAPEGELEKEAGELEQVVAEWLRSSMGEDEELVLPDLDTLMLGSSFNLSLGQGEAGSGSRKEWSAWGRFARDSFEGTAEGLAVEGDVTTGFVGMDVESGSWLWGAALGISDGEGPYRMAENGSESAATEDDTPQWGSGRMESRLTAVYPYGRYAVTDRLDLWAMGGYGEGTMSVEPAGGSALETDLGMTLGAVGARGNLREPPPGGGIALILRADALWVRTESEALRSGSGFLSGAQADTSRMRLILEGERAYRLTNGGTLTPALELGVRQDGGDAETGTGMEAGARISFKRQGLAVEGAVRTLLSHEDEKYGEWGASASIRLEPGKDGRGLSFSVAPSWGATGSAAERLWGLDDTRGLAPDGEFEAGRRIDARVGYGLPVFGGRFTGTPEFGLGVSDGNREYRIGWRLSPVGGGIGPFASFGIHMEAVREVPSRGESESRFGVVLEARF